jgi:hypothetical protein
MTVMWCEHKILSENQVHYYNVIEYPCWNKILLLY